MRPVLTRMLCSAMLAASLVLPAAAATLNGYTLPDTYPVEGQALKINGIGLRTLTVFNVKVYVAGLYLAQPSRDPQQIMASTTPKVVLLQFLHDGSKADVEKQYREGERNNCGGGECDPSDKPDFEKLIAAAPAVKVGDTSTYIFTARGVKVLANNRVIADIANPDLAKRLLQGFIGAHPPSQELKTALLGGSR